jgi:hypothetical protein
VVLSACARPSPPPGPPPGERPGPLEALARARALEALIAEARGAPEAAALRAKAVRLGAPEGDWSEHVRWLPDPWAWLRLDGGLAAARLGELAPPGRVEALGAVGLVVVLRAEVAGAPQPALRLRAARAAGDGARLSRLGQPPPDCGALPSPGWAAWCAGDPERARALLRVERDRRPQDPQALAQLWLAEGVAGEAALWAAGTGFGG